MCAPYVSWRIGAVFQAIYLRGRALLPPLNILAKNWRRLKTRMNNLTSPFYTRCDTLLRRAAVDDFGSAESKHLPDQ
jgi:hypothetical protein